MVEKPESFDNIADVFKLSLAQMEKRFAELEASVATLNEKFKEVKPDALQSLQQRIEDIEDLIMVEQAGIIELQKMLTGFDQKFQEVSDAKSTDDIRNKLREMESKMRSVAESVSKTPTDIQNRLNNLETEVRGLSQLPPGASVDTDRIEKNLMEMKINLSSIKEYTEEAIKNLSRKFDNLSDAVNKPRADFEFVKSRIESLKAGIDVLSGKKMEMDIKISTLEDKIELLNKNLKESLPEQLVDEVKNTKREIVTTNARIESVENVIKNLNENLRDVEKSAKKFEGFEKLTMLNKDVEEKIGKFKLVEEEVKRLSNHVEMMYETIDRRLEKVKGVEEETVRLNKDLESVKDVIDKTRVDIMSVAKKEDFERLAESKIEPFKKGIDYFVSSAKKFDNRIKSLEDVQTELFRQLDAIRSRPSTLPAQKEKSVQVPPISGSIDDIYKSLSNMENKIASLERRIAQLGEPSAVAEAQTADLLDRFVFLESRLAALESSIRKSMNVQPIVME